MYLFVINNFLYFFQMFIYIYIYTGCDLLVGPLWFTRPTLCWIIFILGGDKMYPPHPKNFHHYIIIINNQNTKAPCSFWLCCDVDLPGASRARRKLFYFENQLDFLAFHKSNFLSASSELKQKQMEKKLKESREVYRHILQDPPPKKQKKQIAPWSNCGAQHRESLILRWVITSRYPATTTWNWPPNTTRHHFLAHCQILAYTTWQP